MGRKIRGIFYIAAILLAVGCGKEEETENVFSDGILIEVEAPQTNGWSTEEITGTRSGREKAIEVKGKDGLDMEISTLHDNGATGTAEGEATTRWANMDDNIVFRVVAYKSATAAGISTSNYAGYGQKPGCPDRNLHIYPLFVREFQCDSRLYQWLRKRPRHKRAKLYDVCKARCRYQ